jgi:hypothetical protein
MVDVIIKALNERIAQQIATKTPSSSEGMPASKFDMALNDAINKRDNSSHEMVQKLMEQIRGSETSNEASVLSADNIKINVNNAEMQTSSNFDPKKSFFDLFSTLNNDMLSLDASIEVLSDPNTKLSRRQLLAYQAGIGNITITTELFSKLAQSVSQNLNTLLQTNIG